MMITEMHRRAFATTRPAARRYFPIDFASRSFRGRRSGGHLPKGGLGTVAPSGGAQRQDAIGTPPPTDVALTCYTGGSLARRFHSWSGRSGRRYICSVFPMRAGEPQSGFPEFVDAIVVAVGVAADGLRTPLSFFECSEANAGASSERAKLLAEALAQLVCEWHVHLLATDPELRRRVIQDLESSWFGDHGQPKACSAEQEVPDFQDREAAVC